MAYGKALVLIPCCSEKQVSAVQFQAEAPLSGIEFLRSGLKAMLKETPALANKPENSAGLLNEGAPTTPAYLLYRGKLFRPLKELWRQETVEVLIVSAAYGLVKPREFIRTYELQMGDRFANGQSVYRYWETTGLANLLETYVQNMEVSHIWSLLPNSYTSQSKTPYHRVFRDYWIRAEKRGKRCFLVKVFTARDRAAGTGSGAKRGEWLAEVFRVNPEMLTEDRPSQTEFPGLSGFRFQYKPC
ncbi:MAG: peroxide stress protein YaaA [Deltaproteobacteria bacterium]|nr:peroxide stress protein YaaA [Deltaproteobacteria bacterium]